jgi:hypothetical protein
MAEGQNMRTLNIALSLTLAALFSPILRAAEPTAEVKLDLIPQGAMQKLGGYMPQHSNSPPTSPTR